MCGQRVADPVRSPRRADLPRDRASDPAKNLASDPARDRSSEDSQPPTAPPQDPSTGHKFRDSSPDRRVYTSALGHSVPSELADAMEAARRERRPGAPVRSVRTSEFQSGAGADKDKDKGEGALEQTHKVTLRRPSLSRRRSRLRLNPNKGLLHEVAQSLIWALVLSSLGGLVAWGVYVGLRRGVHPEPQPGLLPPAQGPAVKSVAPSRVRPAARPAPVPPAGHDLVIPIPASAGATRAASAPPPAAPEPSVAAAPSPPPSLPTGHDKSLDDIEFVASNHSPQVRACYDRAFRNAGAQAPAGRVELSFALVDTGEFGRAVEITTELNMLAEPSVSTCLEERIAEWRFPRPLPPPGGPGSPPRRLRYPFVFTPAPP